MDTTLLSSHIKDLALTLPDLRPSLWEEHIVPKWIKICLRWPQHKGCLHFPCTTHFSVGHRPNIANPSPSADMQQEDLCLPHSPSAQPDERLFPYKLSIALICRYLNFGLPKAMPHSSFPSRVLVVFSLPLSFCLSSISPFSLFLLYLSVSLLLPFSLLCFHAGTLTILLI